MKAFFVLLVLATCIIAPARSLSDRAGVHAASVEPQTRLLSLELAASKTDKGKVGDAMAGFARRYGFTTSERPGSPLWDIQRFYVGPHDTSVVLSFFPEHTFVGLSKRPGDSDAHEDIVDGLTATFRSLGFKPWLAP